MNSSQAVTALGALAHEYRLSIYRMLVEAGPEGLNAGTLATRLKLPPSSLTFHVQHLHRAGLITQQRKSRELIYSTDFDVMNGLVGYLTENCCGGKGETASVCETSCAPVRVGVAKKSVKKAVKAA
jgi:DNA-binding transcriptional ArsR family regulator